MRPRQGARESRACGDAEARHAATNRNAQEDLGGFARLTVIDDRDPKIVFLACKICLLRGPASERTRAIRRLISLLPQVDWMLQDDIENGLVAHFESARNIIAAYLQESDGSSQMLGSTSLSGQAKQVLRRVQERSDYFSDEH